MARQDRRGVTTDRLAPVQRGDDSTQAAPTEFVPAPLELTLKVLPEVSVVGVALACVLTPSYLPASMHEMLMMIAVVEGVFCIAQGTLTDIATRLRKPPPAWSVPIILVGLAMVFPEARAVVSMAQELGWAALLGIAWSGAERLRELWTMPRASRLEKLRRRALVGGRLSLLLLFAGAGTALMIGSYLHDSDNGGGRVVAQHLAWFVAAYFSLTTIDVVRVHRAAFARCPRTLLRFDPLGVEYLAPL